jgi:hypothetical protein
MLADLLRLPQGARKAGQGAIAADSAGVSQGHGISHGLARDSRTVRRYEFAGVPVSVEYPAGVRRLLKKGMGRPVYDRVMDHDYGFVENTVGRDGDEIDVIVGPNPQAESAYVVDMIDGGPDVRQRQDEDKLLLGFDDANSAKAAFLSMYSESFFGGMGRMTMDELLHRLHYPSNWDRPEEMFAFAFKNDLRPAKEPTPFGKLFRKFLKK